MTSRGILYYNAPPIQSSVVISMKILELSPPDTRKAQIWFFIFCFLQLVFWTLQPTLTRHNVPLDSAEGLAWGNMWLWGYSKHPPLAAWFTALFTRMGGTVGWPIYLLSQLSIVISFWAMWEIAKKFLPPWQALISIVLLSGIYYYNIASPQFNPNTLMLSTWALTTLAFYYALQQQKPWQWLLVGVFAGLAMLTKYEALLLFGAMFAVLITTHEGRKSFKHIYLYLAFLLAFLIWLPNLIWQAQHDFSALSYASDRFADNANQHHHWIDNIYHPLRFLFEQLGAILPALILLLPFSRAPKIDLHLDAFKYKFLLFMGLGPVSIAMFISFCSGMWLDSQWAYSFLSFTGILLLVWLRPSVSKKSLHNFAILAMGLACILIIGRSTYLIYGPSVFHKTTRDVFPSQQIAMTLTQQWHKKINSPMPYIAANFPVAVNVSAYSPDKPIPYYFDGKEKSPWINEADVRKKGAVFAMVISESSATKNSWVQQMLKQYPQIQDQQEFNFPLQTKVALPPIKVWVGILPPR